ncbi:12565_t:CDS:2 [Funneliformis geosporum]|uniref:12565_t:CDS:1 n=1 Tax=Funneliformis geosporum TaxID=1117311 RepID=A0A9W4SRS3_9GLOM|nr:12565_t:CDS:2 [Funneliformis geosporum]
MFAYSPVETENIFYNPKYSFNNKGVPSLNTNQPSSSSSCSANHHMLSLIPDLQEREQQRKSLEKFHEASIRRIQLKQELQRRHQLCAETERLRREQTEKQNALKKLRSVQNRLSVLKSINLKLGTLTFDLINKNKVLPTSANNKAFLIYKESILKVLDQLDNEFTDEFYLIRERKQFINNVAKNMLQELDRERDSQYETFVGKKEIFIS